MTWSRQGLIGVTAHSSRTNRFDSSKATKTPPSHVLLIKPYDWLAVDLAIAKKSEITGGELSRKSLSLTSTALQEARKALANVTDYCDEVPERTLIHNLASLYPHDIEANALRSCLPEHCVSGCRFCDPTVMLSCPAANDGATLAYCQHRVYRIGVIE